MEKLRPKIWNPPTVAAPFGNCTQCSEVQASERLLYMAGQVGVMPDGSMAKGIEAQAEQALLNILAILEANDMEPENIVKMATFPIRADFIRAYSDARGKVLGDVKPPNTMLVVHALGNPEWLIEIETYAAKP